jgi:hypothetical protein
MQDRSRIIRLWFTDDIWSIVCEVDKQSQLTPWWQNIKF